VSRPWGDRTNPSRRLQSSVVATELPWASTFWERTRLACNFRRPAGKTVFGECLGSRLTRKTVFGGTPKTTRGDACAPQKYCQVSGQPTSCEGHETGRGARLWGSVNGAASWQSPGSRPRESAGRRKPALKARFIRPESLSSVLQRSHQWRSSVRARYPAR
jgi:hypothetical protein